MAKKTSKQGNKANKNSGKKAAEVSSQLTAAASEEPKKVEKPAKDNKSAKDGKPAKAQQKTSKPQKSAPKKDGIIKKITTYIKNVRLEIKRTTWPTREEVLRMSLIVVGALIFFGVFIFIMDWVMTHLLELYAGFIPTPDPAAVDPSAIDPSAVDPSATPDASTPDTSTPETPDASTPDTSGTPDASDTPDAEGAEQ